MIPPLQNERILASAGSGKTWQLTNRYIAIMGQSLLAGEEIRPERIVAVTFTRKAAGEFFESIIEKLAGAASSEKKRAELAQDPADPSYPVLSQLREKDYLHLLAGFLARMPSLFLGTLDSFFSSILHSFPAEFGLSSRFEILDEHSADLARHNVYREVFRSRQEKHRDDFLEAFKRATFGQEEARILHQLDQFVSRHHGIFLQASDQSLWGHASAIWPAGCPWAGVAGSHGKDLDDLFGVMEGQDLPDGQWDYWHEFREQLLLHSPGSPFANRVEYFIKRLLEPGTWTDIQAGEASFTVNRRAQNFNPEACAILNRLTSRLVASEIGTPTTTK